MARRVDESNAARLAAEEEGRRSAAHAELALAEQEALRREVRRLQAAASKDGSDEDDDAYASGVGGSDGAYADEGFGEVNGGDDDEDKHRDERQGEDEEKELGFFLGGRTDGWVVDGWLGKLERTIKARKKSGSLLPAGTGGAAGSDRSRWCLRITSSDPLTAPWRAPSLPPCLPACAPSDSLCPSHTCPPIPHRPTSPWE
jgi:hypothetical protein